jgi:hypothetical protein
MKSILKKILNYYKRKQIRKRKPELFLEKHDLKIISKRITSITLSCLIPDPKKNGKSNLITKKGEYVLENDLTESQITEKIEFYTKEAAKKDIPLQQYLDDLVKSTAKTFDEAYDFKYYGRKLQNLVDEATAFKKFGKGGKQTVRAVNDEVERIIREFSDSNKKLKMHTMVSGMTYIKNGKVSKSFANHNFIKSKIQGFDQIGEFSTKTGKYLDKNGNLSIFQKFLDEMHPTLRKRYDKHLIEVKKGLKVTTPTDIRRGGIEGSHGEIRSLDDLLKEVDPLGKLGDDIFRDIIGYNRFLKYGANMIQPPCVHCNFLTTFVTFIGL